MVAAALLFLPDVTRAELRYSGSATVVIAMADSGAVNIFEQETGKKFISFEVLTSGQGIKALLDGRATIAGCSRPLRPEEKKKKLVGVTIGYDALGIYVHATNPVKNLTMEQLKGIFSGRITNWREVGGKDAPIIPITGVSTSGRGSTDFFREHVLAGAPFGRNWEVGLSRDQAVVLSRHENGITFVSIGRMKIMDRDVRGQITPLAVNRVVPTAQNVRSGAYGIVRPLLLVTRGAAKGEEKAFIDFMLSRGGQAIIEQTFTAVTRFR
jgi:phosphate transport system substrate-binding protein